MDLLLPAVQRSALVKTSIKDVCADSSSLRRALLCTAALWELLILALYGPIYLGRALMLAWIYLYRATNCCSIKLAFYDNYEINTH
jgi:hypothetical protein